MLRQALLGGLAGIVATGAMTVAMRILRRRLAASDRYPLPPREIVTASLGAQPVPANGLSTATMLAHFGYGAATGALYPLLATARGMPGGAGYGVLVWAASYLGWIPAARILVPANRHPAGRNALMIAAHLVWGACLAGTLRELERAEGDIFAEGAMRDVHPARRPSPGGDQPRVGWKAGGSLAGNDSSEAWSTRSHGPPS